METKEIKQETAIIAMSGGINANLTYRRKPVRMLPVYTVANIKLLVGLEYSPELLAR